MSVRTTAGPGAGCVGSSRFSRATADDFGRTWTTAFLMFALHRSVTVTDPIASFRELPVSRQARWQPEPHWPASSCRPTQRRKRRAPAAPPRAPKYPPPIRSRLNSRAPMQHRCRTFRNHLHSRLRGPRDDRWHAGRPAPWLEKYDSSRSIAMRNGSACHQS